MTPFEAHNSRSNTQFFFNDCNSGSFSFGPYAQHSFEWYRDLNAVTWVSDTIQAEYCPKASSRKLKVKNVGDASN